MKRREDVASRLRIAREAAGLTQAQAAAKLRLHRPTLSEIEAGRRRVAAEELHAFAELYGADIEWIVSGEGGDKNADDRILLAARQLSKMKDADLDRLMRLLQMLRKRRGGE